MSFLITFPPHHTRWGFDTILPTPQPPGTPGHAFGSPVGRGPGRMWVRPLVPCSQQPHVEMCPRNQGRGDREGSVEGSWGWPSRGAWKSNFPGHKAVGGRVAWCVCQSAPARRPGAGGPGKGRWSKASRPLSCPHTGTQDRLRPATAPGQRQVAWSTDSWGIATSPAGQELGGPGTVTARPHLRSSCLGGG